MGSLLDGRVIRESTVGGGATESGNSARECKYYHPTRKKFYFVLTGKWVNSDVRFSNDSSIQLKVGRGREN